jgi:hypothetical protein
MRRLGLAVPDSAQVVLLQQEKLGQYYGQLSHALKVCRLAGRVCGGCWHWWVRCGSDVLCWLCLGW